MTRFASRQPDLFAPPAAAADPAPPPAAPLAELAALLDRLRGLDRLPWRDAAATMAEERHAYGLAGLAGPEGERLAAAIMEETERLFAAAETQGE